MRIPEELEKDEMMRHLMDALEQGQDIGHYGRLIFIMGARYFLDNDELVDWLTTTKIATRARHVH
jgi:hypothetical protein